MEAVATLPAHRGRGYASAVVQHAVGEALAAGHDLIFLTALVDDWPKRALRPPRLRGGRPDLSFLRAPAKVALT